MPFDETTSSDAATAPWPDIDPRLLGQARRAPPPFPLHFLPGRWRAWVEACARSLPSSDHVAQSQLAALSAVCGGGFAAGITPNWREPLLLWQALVGEASSGKSAALASGRRLLDLVEAGDTDADGPPARCTLLSQGEIWSIRAGAKTNPRGVMLWSDDLADWFSATRRGDERSPLAEGWAAGRVIGVHSAIGEDLQPLALAVAGTLGADRLAGALGGSERSLASRFLYGWPEPTKGASLFGAGADDEAVGSLLRRIDGIAGSATDPSVLSFDDAALAHFQEILDIVRQQMREADGLEAAWIGKGGPTIARLAGLLVLMHWAEDETQENPAGGITLKLVEDAWALWSDYFLPHAQSVFDHTSTEQDRMVRRVVQWLKAKRKTQVSLMNIRREALAHAVDESGAMDVILRLVSAGALRALPLPAPIGPGRRPRRWEVNPALR